MPEDTNPYQHQSQIEQLLAEKANAEAYGQDDRAAAVDKTLRSLGYREAAKARKQAAENKAADDDQSAVEPRTQAPQGRRAPTKQSA